MTIISIMRRVIPFLGFGVLFLWLRWGAINPGSLWLDDAWVGLIAKTSSWDEFWLVSASSPLFFSALQWIASGIIPDPEFAMQFFPLIFGFAQVVVFYMLIHAVTSNRYLSFLAATLMSVSPLLVLYSTRAKQYTLDALIVTGLILIFVTIGKNDYVSSWWKMILSVIVAMIISFNSVVIGGLIVHVIALRDLNRKKLFSRRWRLFFVKHLSLLIKIVSGLVCFYLACGLYYWFVLKPRANEQMMDFWESGFIDIYGGLIEILKTIIFKLNVTVSLAFPSSWMDGINGIVPFGFLLLVGVVLLMGLRYLWQSNPLLCMVYSSFYVGIVTLAVVGLYPLGGGRTDMYTYPITLSLFVFGIWYISLVLHFFMPVPLLGRRIGIVLLCVIVVSWADHSVKYHLETRSASYVELIESRLNDSVAVIVYPHAIYAYAYYSSSPIAFEPDHNVGTGFRPLVQDNRVFALPMTVGYMDDIRVIQSNIEDTIASLWSKKSVFLFASQYSDENIQFISDAIGKSGFELGEQFEEDGNLLLHFQR